MPLLNFITQNSSFAPKTLHTSELIPIYVAFIFLGIYFTLAIYHLMVYWGRSEDKNNLRYVVLIISFIFYVIQKMLIPEFDPHYDIVPLFYRIILEGLTSLFLIFSFLYFIYYALELQPLKKQLIWGYILCIITPYIVGIILYIIIKNWNIPEIINTVIPVPWSIYIAVRIIKVFFNKKEQRYKQKWKLLIFFGIVLFYLGMIVQTIWIVTFFSYFLQSLMVNIGCLAMALFSAYALTSHFNQEHYHLIDLRDNLEKKVNLRTSELEKAKREIEKASQQKTNLFVNLAHETKTPLTIIQNYLSEYMGKVKPSEELRVIQQNLNKLLRDMVNFLDAEKLERGQIFYNHDQVVNISEIVKDKLKVFRSYAHRKNINLTSNLAIDLYIKADPFALDRIINNILDNAIKYTSQGTIDVFLDKQDNSIILKVKDTGMGISEQQQKHIFSPFYQISHTKQNIQGIGMGLYITSEIIKTLNGTINLNSEKNKGSEFTLTFPRYIPAETDHIKTDFEVTTPDSFQFEMELHQEKYSSQQENILVVEDNKNLLKFLQYKLSKKYNVFTAENGQTALQKISSIPLPNLILSDIMMDEMDGYEFYENIMSQGIYQDIPFIFLTAKTGDKEKLRGLSLGAVDFIYKPFSADELMNRIDALLRLQKMKNTLFEQNKYFTFGKLMGGISHELTNPLISIIAPLENLKKYLNQLDSTTREKTQPYIERIKYNLDRITNIIKNLKSLYYQEKIKKTNLNLSEIIPPIIKLFEDYKDKNVIFSIDIEKDLSIYTNYDALIQILSNLILNALDAVEDQGEITIKAFKTEYDPVIIIKDNGKGISREEQKYIFDAFYTSKDVGEGTGLGLYIVKNLVLKMGWNISVNSDLNKGSEFVITMKRK
ncbi:MAG: ATP-binding protein [bacterium]